jgi:hypothetical protein
VPPPIVNLRISPEPRTASDGSAQGGHTRQAPHPIRPRLPSCPPRRLQQSRQITCLYSRLRYLLPSRLSLCFKVLTNDHGQSRSCHTERRLRNRISMIPRIRVPCPLQAVSTSDTRAPGASTSLEKSPLVRSISPIRLDGSPQNGHTRQPPHPIRPRLPSCPPRRLQQSRQITCLYSRLRYLLPSRLSVCFKVLTNDHGQNRSCHTERRLRNRISMIPRIRVPCPLQAVSTSDTQAPGASTSLEKSPLLWSISPIRLDGSPQNGHTRQPPHPIRPQPPSCLLRYRANSLQISSR